VTERAAADLRRVVALAGGVGGAKLAHGLAALVGDRLTVIVNTGDDTERHGLLVMPDHDTVMYTLAGIANRQWGWGIEGETYNADEFLAKYGQETWFRLGDRDLATAMVRTARLRDGGRLTDVVRGLQRAHAVGPAILPMTDTPVRTEVRTDDGWLDFQEYFVHRRQEPAVHEVRFVGVDAARATPEVLDALATADVVVLAPSNPFVSVAPILAVAGVREALSDARGRGVSIGAVSGIIGGKALKGPADRMLTSLGHEGSALGVARLYAGFVDVFVIDRVDEALASAIEALGMRVVVTDTVMDDDPGRARLAGELLAAVDGATRTAA
jgi:LPPG:FO 2-phospho-L-lactate transferase